MRAEPFAAAVGLMGVVLGVLAALPASPLTPHLPQRALFSPSAFPPPPHARRLDLASRGGLPAVFAHDREIARLGRAPPRPGALRRAFQDAPSLMQFALERLPKAGAGDGASQYFIYLALDQCRAYLRIDFEGASANLERLTNVADLNPEERVAWQSDLERCRGFAVADWSAIGDALGEDEPGSEVEYASVWFERAALSGYAPALVEQALRPSTFSGEQRARMLRDALPQAGADVYWLLFAHSADVDAGEVGVPALAWLIVACRAGQDCTEDARWYRNFVCTNGEQRCAAGQSALEYYWVSASPEERSLAWDLAVRIEAALRAAAWDELPFPDLERLDYHRLWAAPEK